MNSSKYYSWFNRYGKVNEHNGLIPRDHWLRDWEIEKIKKFYRQNPEAGYRRLTYMMLDADIVAVSATTVWRVLCKAGLLKKWNPKTSQKGKGFTQPKAPHEHWHVDLAYVNVCGTFYYLCCVLDGYSRSIVHFDLRPSMTETDVELVVQKAREKFPGHFPRIISDNGPQFISKDFKEFIRITGMSHVRTSLYYPQSNGKLERFHKSIKSECIRKEPILSIEDARKVIERYINVYNSQRLHSAIGWITPLDKLRGREFEIFEQRDKKLETAREKRKIARRWERFQAA